MNEGKIFDSIFNDLKPVLEDINKHDPYTLLHSIQVAKLVEDFCQKKNIKEATTIELIAAALIHDYGKIKVDPDILNKPDKPTDKEYAEIKTHPGYTASLLKIRRNDINCPYLTDRIIKIAAQHHETEGGFGYPDRISAKKILHGAKILHIADVFDALASERPYKEAASPEYIYRTFAGDKQDEKTKEWNESPQVTFHVSLLKSFLYEISLQDHSDLSAEALEYMHKINPEYDPAKEFAKIKGKETKTIDDIIKHNTGKSNDGIENSTLHIFLSEKRFIKSSEDFDLREFCTMKKVMEEMRKSDSIFVEVNPSAPGAKTFTVNGYSFGFKKFDEATKEERTFVSKVTDGYCRGSLTGTLVGNDAIEEAEIKENQNKGL